MVAKRKTLGINPLTDESPLDDLEDARTLTEQRPQTAKVKGKEEEEKFERERFTVNLPTNIITKARSAVYYSHGETLSALTDRALRKEIERMEKQRGEPFPEHESKLSAGRPVRLK